MSKVKISVMLAVCLSVGALGMKAINGSAENATTAAVASGNSAAESQRIAGAVAAAEAASNAAKASLAQAQARALEADRQLAVAERMESDLSAEGPLPTEAEIAYEENADAIVTEIRAP